MYFGLWAVRLAGMFAGDAGYAAESAEIAEEMFADAVEGSGRRGPGPRARRRTCAVR